MRKLFYVFFSLTLFISNIQAQDCNDVTASAVATPSICQSNGSITVTLSGESAGNLVGVEYSLASTTGGVSIGPISSNVFNNLPSGNYNIEVSGYCNTLSGEKIVRTVANVAVTGSYTEPRLSFVAVGATSSAAVPTSRKSYIDYSTGLIVVLLENGNQTDMPTFTITSAPNGVTVPQVINATKATNGSVATGWRYMLDGTWPAGTYTISANDGCYTSVISFVLDEITTVPPGTASYQYFVPYNVSSTYCSKVYYKPFYAYSSTSFPDYFRYYNDGLYEYGMAPKGEMPKDENWFKIRSFTSNSYQDLIDLSPGKLSDYYSKSASNPTLTIYTRVKDCPSAITSVDTYIYSPQLSHSASSNNCAGTNIYTTSVYSDYRDILCYPLTVTITDRSTGDLVYNNANYKASDPAITWTVNTGESFYQNITDANGYQLQVNSTMLPAVVTDVPSPTFGLFYGYDNYRYCDSYDRPFSSTYPCDNGYPNPVYVTVTDNTGAVAYQDTLTSTGSRYARGLKYGVAYTYTFVYSNSNGLTKTLKETVTSNVPKAFVLTKYTTSACSENAGVLRVSTSPSSGYYMKDTNITITGPDGYQTQTTNINYNSASVSQNFAETYLPPGEYTATIVSCGTTYTTTMTVTGGYKAEQLSYTFERDCMGTKLFPSGSLSLDGVTRPTVYFRILNAPTGSGATSKVIASNSNDYFTLTTAGSYILGMMTSNSITACAIKRDTIIYNPQPLALDRDKTSAYACPSGGMGYLTLQATNGTAPYTYAVYDKTNTKELVSPITSSSAIDLGNFGQANETYTVRMSDACGNSFNQQVTLVSLDRTKLAYGQSPICNGMPISLDGFTVTKASYSWTGPNGFTSTEKNPVIPNATALNEGWYNIEINSEACNTTVKDSIYIKVHAPVSVAELNGSMQEVILCPYQSLVIGQAATGGSGDFSYQWAYNNNNQGTGTWVDLPGEIYPVLRGGNSSAYYFANTTSNPARRYVRLSIIDNYCGITYYLYYHTNVKGCMFLVNPDLRSPGGAAN